MVFAADSDYFAADNAFMINLRVGDIAAMIAELAAKGLSVETRAAWDSPETGRFARIHGPEGNAVKFWEPPTGR